MNDKEMGENKTKDIIWRDYFQDISEIREIDDKKIEIHWISRKSPWQLKKLITKLKIASGVIIDRSY